MTPTQALTRAILPDLEKLKNGGKLFLIGSVGYSIIEILWRGNTHWTMSITGGLCYLAIYHIDTTRSGEPWWKKCILCSAAITSLEFLVGCIVNLQLGWNVWSYDRLPGNLMGQICPLFSLLWFFLSIPLIGLSNLLHRRLTSRIPAAA